MKRICGIVCFIMLAVFCCAACAENMPEGLSDLRAAADNIVVRAAAAAGKVPVKSLSFAEKTATVYGGTSYSIRYAIQPGNATDKRLDWTSSNPSVAVVDEDGTVTAKSAGKTTITATARDGSRKKAQMTVYVPALSCSETSITVDKEEGSYFVVEYYGQNWEKDVSVTTKGNCFQAHLQLNAHKVLVAVEPLTTGRGSITFKDRRDTRSSVTVDVIVPDRALSINQYILFEIKQVKKYDFGNQYKIVFTNNTDRDIDGFCFVMIPYDRSGRLKTTRKSPGAHYGECYVPDKLKAGKSMFQFWYVGDEPHEDGVEIALQAIEFSDGDAVAISENDMCWYSSFAGQYVYKPQREAVNAYNGDKRVLRKKSYDHGAEWHPYFMSQAAYFGYRYSGLYVNKVVDYSLSDRAGLKAGDMIVAIDRVAIADDVLAAEKALLRVENGGSFSMIVERPGQGLIDLKFNRYPDRD